MVKLTTNSLLIPGWKNGIVTLLVTGYFPSWGLKYIMIKSHNEEEIKKFKKLKREETTKWYDVPRGFLQFNKWLDFIIYSVIPNDCLELVVNYKKAAKSVQNRVKYSKNITSHWFLCFVTFCPKTVSLSMFGTTNNLKSFFGAFSLNTLSSRVLHNQTTLKVPITTVKGTWACLDMCLIFSITGTLCNKILSHLG